MAKTANKPSGYISRSNLARSGRNKDDARRPGELTQAERKEIADRLAKDVATGKFIDLRRTPSK